jgi:hypothetical protein
LLISVFFLQVCNVALSLEIALSFFLLPGADTLLMLILCVKFIAALYHACCCSPSYDNLLLVSRQESVLINDLMLLLDKV